MLKRILVLDDDPDTLDAIKEILNYSGFEVRTLPSSESLYDVLAEYDPHLLLIDMLLKEKNGGTICRELKTCKDTAELKIILISAYPGLAGSLSKYLCNDYIAKPFDMSVLIDKVCRQLGI